LPILLLLLLLSIMNILREARLMHYGPKRLWAVDIFSILDMPIETRIPMLLCMILLSRMCTKTAT
jgi:hypothetical protein